MKKRFLVAIMIIGSLFAMTGCQMESIPDMSDEETTLVAQYAANKILAYNKKYDTGIATEAEIQKDDEKRARQKQREEEAKAEEANTESDSTKDADGTGSTDTTVTNASLGEFLGLQDVSIDYQSYEICDSYPHDEADDTFFAMDATEGNQLLVLHFNLQNNSSEDQDIDILYQYPLFRVSVNGGDNKNALTTLLLDDLSTFKDTVTAGESREVVLVVELPADEVQSAIDTLLLHVKLNDQNADISLQ
ncbi:MAG: DUF5067 domain-containing protein [Lachnospiraceae bacterium]|nr:DUF5067 domain-containing protein [Lachnospiraceae bacterium]